ATPTALLPPPAMYLRRYSTHRPPPDPHTLSLHDALPISLGDHRRGLLPLFQPGHVVAERRQRGAGGLDRADEFGRVEAAGASLRSEEHTSELQSLTNIVCRLLLGKKKHQRRPASMMLALV